MILVNFNYMFSTLLLFLFFIHEIKPNSPFYKCNFHPQQSKYNQHHVKKRYLILSLDGGGIRGIFTTIILDYIEKKTGKPISHLFDMIAGTSTGALVATLLSLPDDNGNPKYKAEQVVNIYHDYAPKIFVKEASGIDELFHPKYSSTSKRKTLKSFVENKKLNELIGNLVVPVVDLMSLSPYIFTSDCAHNNEHCNYDLIDVIDAASNAPTYFLPTKIIGKDTKPGQPYQLLVDGAIIANSAELLAISEAKENHCIDIQDILLVSIGAGSINLNLSHESILGLNRKDWASLISPIMMESSTLSTNIKSKLLLKENYFRFEFNIDESQKDIANVSNENLQLLKNRALAFIEEHNSELNRLCDLLVNSHFYYKGPY